MINLRARLRRLEGLAARLPEPPPPPDIATPEEMAVLVGMFEARGLDPVLLEGPMVGDRALESWPDAALDELGAWLEWLQTVHPGAEVQG